MSALPIDYSVAISDELRALVCAVRSGGEHAQEGEGPHRLRAEALREEQMSSVFSETRLRRDGTRPLRLVAAELLDLGAMEKHPLARGEARANASFQGLRLFLTHEGECVVQVAFEPEPDCNMRSVYRTSAVRSASEVLKLVNDACSRTARHETTQGALSGLRDMGSIERVSAPYFTDLINNWARFFQSVHMKG